MKVIDLRAEQTLNGGAFCARKYTPDEKLISQVATIISEVRQRGDHALIEFARQFDQVDFTPQDLTVSEHEIQTATGLVKPGLVEL